MTTATVDRLEETATFHPYGGAVEVWKARDREVLFAGPAGTGKTTLNLWKLHAFCMKFPGVRTIMVRKTLTSLTSSAMVSYRENILASVPSQFGVTTFGGTKLKPAGFMYPNGSMVAVGGLDHPDKIKSTEYEMIYAAEVTELALPDYEMLVTRLHRNPKSPFTQLLSDCNPDAPTHWLYQRMTTGKVRMIKSHHQDNPTLYDDATGQWTPVGEQYIDGLKSLTGVRYERMFGGNWVGAEGMVFDQWDTERNLATDPELVELGILAKGAYSAGVAVAGVIGVVDWGYTKPGVLNVWAYDNDGRAYCIYQVYQTQRTLDWWIPKFQECEQRFRIKRFMADPSEPSNIAQCNSTPGLRGKFWPADNAIRAGINAVNQRLKNAGDGRPRLVIRRDGLEAVDASLKQLSQPTCLQEEIPVYVWANGKTKEEPIDEFNHACDTMRYGMLELDNRGARVIRSNR